MRKLFIKSRCPHCRPTLKPVANANINLSPGNRIDIIDNHEWENFGMKSFPVVESINFDSYPTLFLNGIKVKHILSANQLKNFLDGFLEKEKIINERG